MKVFGRACEIVSRNSAKMIETAQIGNFDKKDDAIGEVDQFVVSEEAGDLSFDDL